jgi:hypothetical protein
MKALLSRNEYLFKSDSSSRVLRLGDYQFEYPNGILKHADGDRLLTTRELTEKLS